VSHRSIGESLWAQPFWRSLELLVYKVIPEPEPKPAQMVAQIKAP